VGSIPTGTTSRTDSIARRATYKGELSVLRKCTRPDLVRGCNNRVARASYGGQVEYANKEGELKEATDYETVDALVSNALRNAEVDKLQAEADKRLAIIKSLGEDWFLSGTVITFEKTFVEGGPAYSYAAIKVNGSWYTTGRSGRVYTWEDLLKWLVSGPSPTTSITVLKWSHTIPGQDVYKAVEEVRKEQLGGQGSSVPIEDQVASIGQEIPVTQLPLQWDPDVYKDQAAPWKAGDQTLFDKHFGDVKQSPQPRAKLDEALDPLGRALLERKSGSDPEVNDDAF
jgi:hypothetical protein